NGARDERQVAGMALGTARCRAEYPCATDSAHHRVFPIGAGLPPVGGSMVVRRVGVPKRDVVFVCGVHVTSDGVAFGSSSRGGDLTIVATPSREQELDAMLADLKREIGDGWIECPQREPS